MAILGPFFSEVVAPVEFSAGLFNSDRQELGLDEIQVGSPGLNELKVGGQLVAANFAWAEKS